MRGIAGGVIGDRKDGESDPWSPISSIIDIAALAFEIVSLKHPNVIEQAKLQSPVAAQRKAVLLLGPMPSFVGARTGTAYLNTASALLYRVEDGGGVCEGRILKALMYSRLGVLRRRAGGPTFIGRGLECSAGSGI